MALECESVLPGSWLLYCTFQQGGKSKLGFPQELEKYNFVCLGFLGGLFVLF